MTGSITQHHHALIEAQEASRRSGLTALVEQSRERFRTAADLLNLPMPDKQIYERPLPDERVELGPLVMFWNALCRRYADEIYDAQLNLLERPDNHEAESWSQYLYWALIPVLVADNAVAKNVMQAIGAHVSQSPEDAARTLVTLAKELRLPAPPPCPRNTL